KTLAKHSNGMRFRAFDAAGGVIAEEVYYSIGGGFIQREGADTSQQDKPPAPFSFGSADGLLRIGDDQGLAIWEIVLENEKTWNSEPEIHTRLKRIWQVMQECVQRGLRTEGILPGGLNVRRRAPRLAKKLSGKEGPEPLSPMDWVNVYAMAVNEE